MDGVLRTIVEGEPGIFPDPVARLMRTIGGWFGHRRDDEHPPADAPRPHADQPADAGATADADPQPDTPRPHADQPADAGATADADPQPDTGATSPQPDDIDHPGESR